MTTQVLQLGKVERGLERWLLGLAWLLKYLFLPGRSEKARGGRLREELYCFHDGCPAGLPQPVKSWCLTSLWSRLKAEPEGLAVSLLKPRTVAR